MVPFQPALTLSENMGPARPTSASAEDGVEVAHQIDPRAAGERRLGTLAHRPQREAGPRAEDPPPGDEDEHEAEVGHDVVLEEERAQDRDLLQERDGVHREQRALVAHEGVAQEVRKVATEQA